MARPHASKMVHPVTRDSHIEGNTHCNTASPAIPSKAHNALGPGRTKAAASQNPEALLALAFGNPGVSGTGNNGDTRGFDTLYGDGGGGAGSEADSRWGALG